MGWAASPGAGPRDGERQRVARRGRAWTGRRDRCAEVTAARTGPTTQSSTVQTPHCGGLCVPAAGPRGRRKGPAGLTPRGGGPAGPGPPGRAAPACPLIAPLSIYLQIYNMRHDTCALLVAGPCTTVRRPDRDATREDRRTRPISEHARETRRAGPHALTYRRDHTHTARDMRITHGSRMPCTYSPG
jgi:hypothetical protein